MRRNHNYQEACEVLSSVSYFSDLDQRTLETVAESAISYNYDPGQLVILEGEPATGIYIIQHGWLKVSKIAPDGREQILQLLGDGEVFNAVSVFSGAPNLASVTALETTRLWIIRREAILRLVDTNPRIAGLIIQDLSGRITHLISLIEDLSLRTVEARLARLLLEESSGDQIKRKKWATQTEMASRLGTVPDVIGRALRKLSDQGLIQFDRQEIHILNRPGLEMIARIEV